MNTILYFLLGFGYLILLIWGLQLAKKQGLINLTNVMLLVILALVYDNFIIALGKFIGEGNTLKVLTYFRYLLHALFTPMLILFLWGICYKLRMSWARNSFWKVCAYLLTFGFIIFDVWKTIKGLKVDPKWENGLLTYESVGQSGSPLMIIVITLFAVILGIILFKNFQFKALLVGTIIMLVGGLLGIWIKNFPIMNVMEFIFIVSLVKTKQFEVAFQASKS